MFVFPALVVLRRKYPYAHRPYRVPGGTAGASVAVLLTEAFVVVTAVTLLWPGAINSVFGGVLFDPAQLGCRGSFSSR
jgi:hypothetical protein